MKGHAREQLRLARKRAWDAEKLAWVFDLGNPYAEALATNILELEMCIREGSVMVRTVRLSRARWIDRRDLAGFTGQLPHQVLCLSVARCFESQRIPWTAAAAKLHYQGGIADVAAQDRSVFAECRYTGAAKLLEAMKSKPPVLVVPYQEGEDLRGFMFQRNHRVEIQSHGAEEEAKRRVAQLVHVPYRAKGAA